MRFLYFAAINSGDYKRFSKVYDGLARLGVPLNVWKRSHSQLIKQLPQTGVLWVFGSGTGTALKGIPKSLQIVSVDASAHMEVKARKAFAHHQVLFVQDLFQELDLMNLPKPDAILFPYFLQMVEFADWQNFEAKLAALKLSKSPEFYVLDFVAPPELRIWQRMYIPVLLGFYAWASGQSANRLSEWFAYLDGRGYRTLFRRTWLQGLVEFRRLQASERPQ
ncbi:MAG: hypothetical protein RL577_985 [Bacteroidota bacterium]